jgi:hypothetical protein
MYRDRIAIGIPIEAVDSEPVAGTHLTAADALMPRGRGRIHGDSH